MQNNELVALIDQELKELKANNLVWILVKPENDYADHLAIVTGTSTTHIKSIVSKLVNKLAKIGYNDISLEGLDPGNWILIDLIGIVIHVQDQNTRDYYGIEQIYKQRLEFDENKDCICI